MPTSSPVPKLERWLVLPDEQWPFADKVTIKAVEAYMAAYRWDGVISLGDFLDLHMISRWVDGQPRKVEGKRFKYDIELARMVLERRINLLRYGTNGNPTCKYVYIQGNHDARIEDVLDKHPVFEGLLELESVLGLKQLGIDFVPFWRDPRKVFKKGKATFIHGLYTNQYHAAKHVSRYGGSVFYGHLHDVQEHSVVFGTNTNAITGKSLGCLCDPKQMEYIAGKPQNWVQACSTFFFFPDGNFTEYTSKIFNHRFVSPDGAIYDGNLIPDSHHDQYFVS